MHTNNPQGRSEETLIVSYSGESVEIVFNELPYRSTIGYGRFSGRMTFSDSSSACLLEDVDEKSVYMLLVR